MLSKGIAYILVEVISGVRVDEFPYLSEQRAVDMEGRSDFGHATVDGRRILLIAVDLLTWLTSYRDDTERCLWPFFV